MHKFLVCAYKSQDFAQSQRILARLHDRETMTFRNFDGFGVMVFYRLGGKGSLNDWLNELICNKVFVEQPRIHRLLAFTIH